MDNPNKKERKSKPLLIWLVCYAIGLNLFLYLINIYTTFSIKRRNGDPITFENVLLAGSPDWHHLILDKIQLFILCILGGVGVWLYSRYRNRKSVNAELKSE